MLAREEGNEKGNWEDVVGYAKKLNVPLSRVKRAYNEAMVWARESLHDASGQLFADYAQFDCATAAKRTLSGAIGVGRTYTSHDVGRNWCSRITTVPSFDCARR
jgi:hypothetical protein